MGIWVSLRLVWLSLFRFGYPCSCSGFVCVFVFLERTWSCLFLWGFLCVFFSEEKYWVYGFARDWIGYWVYGFISLIYLWFGLVSWIYFLFFWIWWSRFGLWIWIWICGLLEISLFHGFMKNTKNNFSPYKKIMKVKKKKFKFCFLIYFLFWFKLSDMAFYKKLKCWHGR